MRALLAALLLSSAASAADPKALSSYKPDFSRPLEKRVDAMPEWLLQNWRDADKRPNYRNHELTDSERREFEKALAALPAKLRAALDSRVIGLYFIENLMGNGITDWVLDANERTHVYLAFNPAAFKKSVSQLLSERESSPFKGEAGVKVEAGADNGIVYSVAHEFFHAYDYVNGVTAYTDPGHADAIGLTLERGWDVWAEYRRPSKAHDFPARERLNFYGFKPPLLEPSEAEAVCGQLSRSVYVSLYGAKNWADDAAELFLYRHLTKTLQRPYVYRCGKKSFDLGADQARQARAARILAPLL